MRFLNITATAITLTAISLLAGCAAVGAIAYKVTPIGTTPATYTPAKELSVVFVRNTQNPGTNEIEADQLGRLIADELRNHQVVPMVDDNTVINIRDRDPKGFLKLSVADLGKAAGAKQVFFVELSQASVEPAVGDQMVKGALDCTIRVVDVATGQLRWPTDAVDGWPLSVETGLKQVDEKLNVYSLQRQMQETIAIRAGRLFYPRLEEDDTPVTSPDGP